MTGTARQIAGKLAAKAGLFATLALLLKKFWIVPLLVFGWLGKRLFGKKTETQTPLAEPVAPEQVDPPARTVLDLNKADDNGKD